MRLKTFGRLQVYSENYSENHNLLMCHISCVTETPLLRLLVSAHICLCQSPLRRSPRMARRARFEFGPVRSAPVPPLGCENFCALTRLLGKHCESNMRAL